MKVVVFDFDGVLIPSEGIKRSGYSWIFSEYGEDVPESAIAEAREEFKDAKGDRYDIIRGILLRIGIRGDIEQKVAMYADRFNEIVNGKINAFEVSSGVRRMLESLSSTCALYVNSNTPDDSLRSSLEKLDIARYFKGVFGSSLSKVAALREIARIESAEPAHIVFIGDGEGDLQAAREFGCLFVGIATDQNGWTGRTDIPVLDSVAHFTESHGRVV